MPTGLVGISDGYVEGKVVEECSVSEVELGEGGLVGNELDVLRKEDAKEYEVRYCEDDECKEEEIAERETENYEDLGTERRIITTVIYLESISCGNCSEEATILMC